MARMLRLTQDQYEVLYDLLDYNNTLNFLNNRSIENIYCKLDYNFQNKKYSIFQK